MENSALLEKVAQELEILENIYADDNVIAKPAQISEKHAELVECMFKFTPNTGFDHARISVIVLAKFEFSNKVENSVLLTFIVSI
jgi:hypothetical protein